ncbi:MULTISPECIES: hypothetical protein [Streptomyces]|uniref:hypothetical protein n=1 Tax=Streptomyces TaxID=1883 RepID=UPI0019648E8D|nr:MULTISPECIES: hypothetical protein [Streptomyces]QRX94380.1 hypothetical protein JNO44_29215 [Streptomyces noursei]UJB44090.1 hypothetical protein HRD51_27750 [Streptomyces sp. A1-5]
MNQPTSAPPTTRPTLPAAARRRCPAAAAADPTPCDGPPDAATLIDRHGRETAGCVQHCARRLPGLDGARVHPFVPTARALDIYFRASELPPFAWEIGR